MYKQINKKIKNMKNVFSVSILHKGILGGVIYLDNNGATFQTSKITVAPEYRDLKIIYSDMTRIECGWAFVFPTVLIRLQDDKVYKFIVFNRNGFINRILVKKE